MCVPIISNAGKARGGVEKTCMHGEQAVNESVPYWLKSVFIDFYTTRRGKTCTASVGQRVRSSGEQNQYHLSAL